MALRTKDIFIFFRLTKHCSQIRNLNYYCKPAPFSRLFKECLPSVQSTNKRLYALKIYSQYFPEKEKLSDKVFEYIKQKNNLKVNDYVSSTSNTKTFDNQNTIKQLRSVVLHSLQPSPIDVLKLFSLYATCHSYTLHHTFSKEDSSKILQYRIESTIPHMSFDELHQFSMIMKNVMLIKLKIFKDFAKLIFEESLRRAELTDSLPEAFKYFIIGLEMYGNGINTKKGYVEFLSIFEKHLKSAKPPQLTQLLHFVGLAKNKGNSSNLSLIASKALCPHFEELSFIDAGLAISGIFKLGLEFEKEDPFAHLVAAKLMERMDTKCNHSSLNTLESFAFISMIKYLRFCHYRNIDVLESLKLFLIQMDKESFNPRFVSHVLALYANCNYYDLEVYELLVEKFHKYLESPKGILRIRDISRVMWALSHVQHPCPQLLLNLVIKSLEDFSETGELLIHPSHVVDSTLALSTLNVYPEKLICKLLHPNLLQNIRERDRSRYLSRLLVLREIQKTIFPTYSSSIPDIQHKELPRRSISDECFHRPCIKRIHQSLVWLQNECGVQIFKLKFLIPHINYCSIVLNYETPKDTNSTSDIGERVLANLAPLKDTPVAIEVNDANTTLVGGDEKVIGIEALKRELLRRQGWKIKVISAMQVEGCGDDIEALAALIVQNATHDQE